MTAFNHLPLAYNTPTGTTRNARTRTHRDTLRDVCRMAHTYRKLYRLSQSEAMRKAWGFVKAAKSVKPVEVKKPVKRSLNLFGY